MVNQSKSITRKKIVQNDLVGNYFKSTKRVIGKAKVTTLKSTKIVKHLHIFQKYNSF